MPARGLRRRLGYEGFLAAVADPDHEGRALLNDLVEQGYLDTRGKGLSRTCHLTAGMYSTMGGAAGYVRTRGIDDIQQQHMIRFATAAGGSMAHRGTLGSRGPDDARPSRPRGVGRR